jgi:hypothetical protein
MSDLAPPGLDLVVVARPIAVTSGLHRTSTELRGLLGRLRSGR